MNLFDYFKKDEKEEIPKDRYWSLTTSEEEIIDPTWDQIKLAINHAHPNQTVFVSLAYYHSELAIEVIQAMGDYDVYRLEALPPKNIKDTNQIFVKDSVSYEDTVTIFEYYFKEGTIEGYETWMIEKIDK